MRSDRLHNVLLRVCTSTLAQRRRSRHQGNHASRCFKPALTTPEHSGVIPEHSRTAKTSRLVTLYDPLVARPVRLSPRRRLIWWAFAAVVTAATILITAEAVGIVEWLNATVGLVAVLLGCGLLFAAILWMASRLDD